MIRSQEKHQNRHPTKRSCAHGRRTLPPQRSDRSAFLLLATGILAAGLHLPADGQEKDNPPPVPVEIPVQPEPAPKQPPDPYLAREKGIRAMSQGIFGAAARFFLEYRAATEQREPDFADATAHLTKAYLSNGNVDAAAQALDYHAVHSKNLNDPHYQDAIRYWRAAVLLAQRLWKEAIENAKPLTAPDRTPEFRNLALQLLGDAYVAQGQWQEAEAVLSQLLREFPKAENTRRAKLGLIKVHLAMGKSDKAAQMLSEIDPGASDENQLAAARYRILLNLIRGETQKALETYQTIAPQRPKETDADWWITTSQLAAALMRDERYEDALTVLPHATGLAPTKDERVDSMLRTAEAQIALEKPALAIDTLEAFRNAFPERDELVPVMLKLAELLRKTENYLTAAEYLGRVMEREQAPLGFRYRAAMDRGWCFRDAGQSANAISAFAAGEALGSTPAQKAQAVFLAADTAFHIGNFGDAVTYYRRVADAYAETDFAEEARFRQARAHSELEAHGQAAGSYAQFLEEFPESALVQKAKLERGIALRKAASSPAEFGTALAALKSFADTYPDAPNAPRALMEAFEAAMGAGDLAKAVSLLSALMDKYPGSDLFPYALYNRARVRFYQAENQEAVRDSERFLERYDKLPLGADILMYLGDYYNNAADYEQAKKSFLRLVNTHGTSPLAPTALYEAARAAYKLEQLGSAGVLLDKLLAVESPQTEPIVQARAEFLLGDVLSQQGKYREAMEHFAKARELAADDRLGLAALGRRGEMLVTLAAENAANMQEAIACFEAIAENPAVPADLLEIAKYRLAKCHEMRGETDQAVKIYLDIVFQYNIERERGKLRDWFYFSRAAYDAAHLLELRGEKSDLRQAARVYERLAKTGLPTAEEALRRAKEIRRTHQMDD